ncbi:Der1-like family-domain-containing protein [Cladochytrium replicatum]|nr:Der1-like family-domain-containing protein [Cladochytrium replicatum]
MSAINAEPPSPLQQLQHWFQGLPLVTRWLVTSLAVSAVTSGLGLVRPTQLLVLNDVLSRNPWQIWRFFTAPFYSSLGFPFLMDLYFTYQYSVDLEQSFYMNKTGDYLFFVLFGIGCMDLSSILGQTFLGSSATTVFLASPTVLVTYLIYVWSQHRRETQVSFFFGITFQGMWLPWVLLGYDFLLGNTFPVHRLAGILIGHLFHFLDKIYPEQNGGRRVLVTPQFLVERFNAPPPPNTASGSTSSHPIPPASSSGATAATGPTTRYRWGSGQRLGSD